MTFTPKEGQNGKRPDGSRCSSPNCDSQNHGRNLSWAVGENCAQNLAGCVVLPRGRPTDIGEALLTVNPDETFNLTIEPKRRGGFKLWGVLREPQGVFWQERFVQIQ